MSNRRKSGDFNLDEELRSNISANEEGTPIKDDHEDAKVLLEKLEEALNDKASVDDAHKEYNMHIQAIKKDYEVKLGALKEKYKDDESNKEYAVELKNLRNEEKKQLKEARIKYSEIAEFKEYKNKVIEWYQEAVTKLETGFKTVKEEKEKAIASLTDETKLAEAKKDLVETVKKHKEEIKALKKEKNDKINSFKLSSDEKKYNISRHLKRRPELLDSDILLSVRNLKQFFFFGHGASRTKLKAVSNVSFDVHKGECFGIVGESGCGKTTTGRSIIKLYDITSGSIYYKGYRISAGDRWNRKEIKFTKIREKAKLKSLAKEYKENINKLDKTATNYQEELAKLTKTYQNEKHKAIIFANNIVSIQKQKIKQIKFDNRHVPRKLVNEIQMIFQDPVDSLDPRMTVEDIIQEGLKIQGHHNKAENHKVVVEMLEKVGLVADHASRYPHEFSGGQRQRIGIARALVMNPQLLICDEPISALDVSIRAQIINLLNDLKDELGLTIIFIAHDLSVVKYFCDRIAVMYFGKVVELASSDELFRNPLHPYTKSLLSAIPKPNPITEKTRQRLIYNPKEAHDYSVDKPEMREIKPGHQIYCNEKEFQQYLKELH